MMKLIQAPNHMLETGVRRFDLEVMHPAPIALDMIEIMVKFSPR